MQTESVQCAGVLVLGNRCSIVKNISQYCFFLYFCSNKTALVSAAFKNIKNHSATKMLNGSIQFFLLRCCENLYIYWEVFSYIINDLHLIASRNTINAVNAFGDGCCCSWLIIFIYNRLLNPWLFKPMTVHLCMSVTSACCSKICNMERVWQMLLFLTLEKLIMSETGQV